MPHNWMLGRLAPPVGASKDTPGYCERDCPNVPALAGLLGAGVTTHRHWHYDCWSCGESVTTRAPLCYDCDNCGVSAAPGCHTHSDSDYDPEFAARMPSPG